ncbi:MAG: TonB-dependent receptor plug domain-containing protein [Bacteroidia bacterium]
MKHIYTGLLCLLFGIFYTQTIKVYDKSSLEPISNAIIIDVNNQSAITNNKGIADISMLSVNDSLLVKNISYHNKKFLYSSQNAIVYLSSKLVQLDEIILSANKVEEKMIDVPYAIQIIKQKDIEFVNQQTSADLLQNTGAVFVQKSQMGGGSPVLRGFEANKVLIVVDGIRMNNAIYRGGHLQDVITLDANMLERTEIIFGPSSTIYGSDALGGVMHFYTKQPIFSSDDKLLVKTNTMLRYASANNETTGHLDFNIGTQKLASMTNLTYSSFDELKSGTTKLAGTTNAWDCNYFVNQYTAPNGLLRDSIYKNLNTNEMKRSGYDQIDLMQRFKLKQGENILHELNFQYSQSSNIARYDRLSEYSGGNINVYNPNTNLLETTQKLKYGDWYYGPQKRLLAAYIFNSNHTTTLSDNIRFTAAYQKIHQDRHNRRFQSDFLSSQFEDLNLISFNADIFKRVKEKHEIRYGAEFTTNDVTSTAEVKNIQTNTVSPGVTRYANGGNTMQTIGAYISHAWEVNQHFVISDGLRFTANSLTSNFTDTLMKFPFTKASQKNNALTGCLGLTWKELDNYKVSLLANTGFRTPNIDDMSKVFESAGSILIVPNAEIKPEYATNFELSISKVIDKNYRFDFTAYYTLLENALVLADYKFNGSDSILYNGSMVKTQAIQNKDRAYIYGVTGGIQFDFNENLSLKSMVNYVYGRYADVKNDTIVPLDHIPPVFGQTSLYFKEKRFDGEFFIRYNGIKKSEDYSPSGEDNAKYSADPIKGRMPAWFTVNIRTGYNINKNFRLNVACENITDNRYRVFASGINAPGRNFIISLRAKF